MNKEFTLVQLFSIVDGRLSTCMDDVYSMLNHIFDTSFYTHELPAAMNILRDKRRPNWYTSLQNIYLALGCTKDKEFEEVFEILTANDIVISIPQL